MSLWRRLLLLIVTIMAASGIEAGPSKKEPPGFQFRALLFDTGPENRDAFDDELAEPLAKLGPDSVRSIVLIKLKILNKGKTATGVSYLCIDHVYDRKKGTVFKLLNTIVFKIKQEQISLVHDLSFLQVVNGLPQEEVINKNSANFTGCYAEGIESTCGLVSLDNVTVPFSQGFCCSCDPDVNEARERDLSTLCIESEKIKYYNVSVDGKIDIKYLGTDEEDKMDGKCRGSLGRSLRSIEKTGLQVRGGQSCVDRTHPKGVDPVKYHESAHCLRFSKLWYNVYKVHEPKLENIVLLQMFRKRHPERAGSGWLEITKATPSVLGSSFRSFSSDRYQTLFMYADRGNQIPSEYKLQGDKYLLKPRLQHNSLHQPLARGGAKEYLLVDSSLFDFDGASCDKIGVSFLAFSRQSNRCGLPKGSCLFNQPYALWLRDKKRLRRGLKGHFMLRNFAAVSEQAPQSKNSLSEERLHLDYSGLHLTKISVGIDNFVDNTVSMTAHGILSEIYVDAANEYSTSFIINMINDGLVESKYRVALANLPEPLPRVWHATPSSPFSIAAHNGYSIRLQMYGKLPLDKFHITVELQTGEGSLISWRRAVVQNDDRCYCLWECECACEGSVLGLGCRTLDQRSYAGAGYQGAPPPPRPSTGPRNRRRISPERQFLRVIVYIALFFATLLAMGVVLCLIRMTIFLVLRVCFHKKVLWKDMKWQIIDGALMPFYVTSGKEKYKKNTILINIFFFWMVPVAVIIFIFHLLTLRKEIFGRKEVKIVKEVQREERPQEIQEVEEETEIVAEPIPPKKNCEDEYKDPCSLGDEQDALKSKTLWLEHQRRKYNIQDNNETRDKI